MDEKKVICIEDTKFIYQTNFSGDPERDAFGSDARKGNLIIPDPAQARELMDMGVNVRETKPGPDDDPNEFVPTYFVAIKVNYDSAWPPKIYLVSGDAEPRELDAETVGLIDTCYVRNVNAVLSTYRSPKMHATTLYVKTMYVEQNVEADPFASRYR